MNQGIKKMIVAVSVALLLFQSCSKQANEVRQDITYNNEVQTIMYNYCTSCHGGSAPSANVDLTTYQNVKNQATQGRLVERMNDPNNPMPASGLISESDRKKIDAWVESGCPE